MPLNRIVARYRDGRRVKGTTSSFDPNATSFLLKPLGAPPEARPVPVDLAQLKAIFFVRDFAGNASRPDRKHFVQGQAFQGAKVQVDFFDGEKLTGSTCGYSASTPGFFVFPADDAGNSIKVFAVNSSVRSVQFLHG